MKPTNEQREAIEVVCASLTTHATLTPTLVLDLRRHVPALRAVLAAPVAPAAVAPSEDAYVAQRMTETLAEVAAIIIGDDAKPEDEALNAIERVKKAAQVLRLEVDLYRAQKLAENAQEVAQPDERAAFEAYCGEYVYSITRDETGYLDSGTAHAWKGWQARASAPQAGALTDEQHERVIEAVAEALGDALDCTRVWSAWGVGTMSEDDFTRVADDDSRVAEIADAAISALLAAQGGNQ